MRLQDRIAVVTGGSSGIGRGICRELAKVVVADMQEAPKVGGTRPCRGTLGGPWRFSRSGLPGRHCRSLGVG